MRTERKHRPGGFYRSILRFKKNEEAARRAEEELKMFKVGEPSGAFFPPADGSEVVIYLADRVKKKESRERDSVATAQDIENRKRDQLERYVEYEYLAGHPARLPMPWIRFAIKHWDEIQKLKVSSGQLSSAESSLSS